MDSCDNPDSLNYPLVARHHPLHELVEQGHGKCRIAMAGAPDHALGDQLTARYLDATSNRRNASVPFREALFFA
jgi:hypothetical protein